MGMNVMFSFAARRLPLYLFFPFVLGRFTFSRFDFHHLNAITKAESFITETKTHMECLFLVAYNIDLRFEHRVRTCAFDTTQNLCICVLLSGSVSLCSLSFRLFSFLLPCSLLLCTSTRFLFEAACRFYPASFTTPPPPNGPMYLCLRACVCVCMCLCSSVFASVLNLSRVSPSCVCICLYNLPFDTFFLLSFVCARSLLWMRTLCTPLSLWLCR